jgi:hypothetical protein
MAGVSGRPSGCPQALRAMAEKIAEERVGVIQRESLTPPQNRTLLSLGTVGLSEGWTLRLQETARNHSDTPSGDG